MEQIRRRYAATAAENRCPLHGKDARVEVESLPFGALDIEVFTCCDAFAQRVRLALESSETGKTTY